MYFVDLESGEYEFNPQKLTEAYKWCWQVANDDLIYYGKVIVSNTFTTWKEILPYVQRAQRMDILIDIIETDTPWARNPQKCADKNQHAVPLAEIKRQLSRWEEIPTGIFNAKTLLEKMK